MDSWSQGMVEFLECEIRSFFSGADPSADSEAAEAAVLTFAGLSSYERLLAHACSAYNSLHSSSSGTQFNKPYFRLGIELDLKRRH